MKKRYLINVFSLLVFFISTSCAEEDVENDNAVVKLFQSIDQNDKEMVMDVVLSDNVGRNTYHPKTGESPLYRALNNGDLEMFIHLLKGRADPNASSHANGEDPLGARVILGKDREEFLEACLRYGMDPNLKTVLDIESGEKGPIIFIVASGDDIGYLTILLRYGADANVSDPQGRGLLERAVIRHSYRTAWYLVKQEIVEIEGVRDTDWWRDLKQEDPDDLRPDHEYWRGNLIKLIEDVKED